MRYYVLVVLLLNAVYGHAAPLPRPDHIVIVIEENKSYAQIMGHRDAPTIHALAKRGALFTQSYGVTYPSQPNYLALFSGSTHGQTGNTCPLEMSGSNLASALMARGLSFVSYAESLPWPGYAGCSYGAYKRKHNPLSNWKSLSALNQPFSAFPKDFSQLPTVAFVIPDQSNDMHDGSVAQADSWLSENIMPYAQWAMTHNSLLIVTWDEDDGSADNHITTILVGPMVKPGTSAQRINHYNLLRTIEEMFDLPFLGNSADAQPITTVWRNATKNQ